MFTENLHVLSVVLRPTHYSGVCHGASLFAVTLLAASELDEEAGRRGRKGPRESSCPCPAKALSEQVVLSGA